MHLLSKLDQMHKGKIEQKMVKTDGKKRKKEKLKKI